MSSTASSNISEVLSHPVVGYLPGTEQAQLEAFLSQGASPHKCHRLLQFLKALDWLPLGQIRPNPMSSYPPTIRQALTMAIQQYLQQKDTQKQEAREKRSAYQQKVTEYFKAHVSAQDKKLLEALRDYELDKTGSDRNWQHYFRFTSYKQIDAFCQGPSQDRMAKIEAFKHDIDLYLQNKKRLEEGTYGSFYWGYDDLVTLDEDLNLGHVPPPEPSRFPKPVIEAMAVLNAPGHSDFATIRAKFREAVHAHHPDRPSGNTERMREAIAAYEVLKQYFTTTRSQAATVG